MKAEVPYFLKIKVFYPSKSFLPLFSRMKIFKNQNFQTWALTPMCKFSFFDTFFQYVLRKMKFFVTKKTDESYQCVVSETGKCYITLRKKMIFFCFFLPLNATMEGFFSQHNGARKTRFFMKWKVQNLQCWYFLRHKKIMILTKMKFPIVNIDLDFRFWFFFSYFHNFFVSKTHYSVRKSPKMTKIFEFFHFINCNFFWNFHKKLVILLSFYDLWYFFNDFNSKSRIFQRVNPIQNY